MVMPLVRGIFAENTLGEMLVQGHLFPLGERLVLLSLLEPFDDRGQCLVVEAAKEFDHRVLL